MVTVYLVDGDNLIHRAFHAIPAMTSRDGIPTEAARGFCNSILNAIDHMGPGKVVCAFDGGVPEVRKLARPEYKANRGEKAEELASQLVLCRETICPAMGWGAVWEKDTEADDIIYSLALRCQEAGYQARILSGDKDLAQCLSTGAELYRPDPKASWKFFGSKETVETFGVTPDQIPDFLAICGDTCDNLSGVQGAGPKTTARWLSEHGSLDGIIQAATEGRITPARLAERVDGNLLRRNLVVTQAYDTEARLPETSENPNAGDILKGLGLFRIAQRIQAKPKQDELF